MAKDEAEANKLASARRSAFSALARVAPTTILEDATVPRSELARMASNGPTAEELEGAKQYLTGSYALRFDTSSKISSQLLGIQIEDLGIDYVDKRNGLIDAIRIEDVKRVAKRVLKPENLILTIVGRPQSG